MQISQMMAQSPPPIQQAMLAGMGVRELSQHMKPPTVPSQQAPSAAEMAQGNLGDVDKLMLMQRLQQSQGGGGMPGGMPGGGMPGMPGAGGMPGMPPPGGAPPMGGPPGGGPNPMALMAMLQAARGGAPGGMPGAPPPGMPPPPMGMPPGAPPGMPGAPPMGGPPGAPPMGGPPGGGDPMMQMMLARMLAQSRGAA